MAGFTLLHGYAKLLKTHEKFKFGNRHNPLILLNFCHIHATSVDAPFWARENVRNRRDA